MSTPKHPFDAKKIPAHLKKHVQFHAIPINTSPSLPGAIANLWRSNSYHFQRFTDGEFMHSLSYFLANNQYDAILLDGLYAAPYLDLIRRMSHAPVILRTHNVEHEIWLRYAEELKNPLKRWYFRLQVERLAREEKDIATQMDGIIPISRLDEMFFRQHNLRARIATIPFALDLEKYPASSTANQSTPTVAHIGAMDWLPNQEGIKWFLQEVWPLVTKEVPAARFYLAGRNMPHWMEQYSKPGVHLAGEVDNAIEFMEQHSIIVVPLFSGSGLRIKILEAMALGKPVVATTLAAEAIGAEYGKEIWLADEAPAFANHVKALLQSQEQRNTTGRFAREKVQAHFNMHTLTQQFAEYLKKMTG